MATAAIDPGVSIRALTWMVRTGREGLKRAAALHAVERSAADASRHQRPARPEIVDSAIMHVMGLPGSSLLAAAGAPERGDRSHAGGVAGHESWTESPTKIASSGRQSRRWSAIRTGSGSGLCRVEASQPTIVSM